VSPADLDSAALMFARTHGHSPVAERAICAFSRSGEHAACWISLGLLGGALAKDGHTRRGWLRGASTVVAAYGLNYAVKLAVRRRRPELDGPVLPERPRDHLIRRGARLFTGRATVGALRGGGRLRAQPALPGRSLPDRRDRRGAPRHRDRRGVAAVKVGIVGLPNAGKSSLFSALTGVAAEAANYPFTTIEPNVAVVPVADSRLDAVARTVGASKVVPDTIAFHDIAGLVAGAHRGEGLGNQFLANIRETDAIVHVVRAHRDPNVVHPEGRVDPLSDIETIETELIYADLEQAERRLERVAKTAKSGERRAVAEAQWLRELIEALQSGRPARTVPPSADAPDAVALLAPLTAKPVLFVANVEEGETQVPEAILEHARTHDAEAVAVSARLEAELAELPDEEAEAMRADLGLSESGLQAVVRGAFSLLALVAFFTAGEAKPAQSWHLRHGLSVWHAAGLVHSDIQRGFVRAEVLSWQDLVEAGGYAGARERGTLRLEGRDYVVADGDVITVRFTP
jgi:GTP-binding protein YchF